MASQAGSINPFVLNGNFDRSVIDSDAGRTLSPLDSPTHCLESLFGRVVRKELPSPSVFVEPDHYSEASSSYPTTALSSPHETTYSRELTALREENQIGLLSTQQSLALVDDLTSFTTSATEILSKLKALSEFPLIAEQVGLALNCENPQRVIEANPFVLLRIRSYDGINLLEQLRSALIQRLDLYQSIDQLLDLEHYAYTRFFSAGFPPNPDVKAEALEKFNALPQTGKNAFCERVWILCGSPKKINFGEKYILQKRNIAFFHHLKGEKITQAVVKQLQEKTQTPITFNTMYVYPEEVKLTDSPMIREDMHLLYQVQDFNNFLHDPFKVTDPHFLSRKFQELNPEIREALCKLAWISSYRPDILDFGSKFIQRDFTLLLEMQDPSGKPILNQMVEHLAVKIQAQRELQQLEAFLQAAEQEPPLSKSALYRVFSKLDEPIQARLRRQLWLDAGGASNPRFGGARWARKAVKNNPLSLTPQVRKELSVLQEKAQGTLSQAVDQFEAATAIPEDYIVNSIATILNDPEVMESAPTQIQVAITTAEFAGVINVGGLAGAVQGIAKGLGERNVHVIMPKFDTLRDEIKPKLTPVARLQVQLAERVYRVFEATHNGTHFYFIEDDANFTVGYEDGKPLNIYQHAHGKMASDSALKRRWAAFQSIAAELIYKLSKEEENPVNVLQVHDAQTALIPSIIKARHPEEWLRGETPATVFTFHNNLCQQVYNPKQLEEIGLRKGIRNSFTQGLQDSEVVSTVSRQFAIEAQIPQFGHGVHEHVKAVASKGKLFGIVNGNTNDWDPATNTILKNWKTLDGKILDLSYGPHTDLSELRLKQLTIRKELASHLAHHKLAKIDPEKPIIFFLGRYDSNQKGIDKLPIIMEEALANGAQFICVGTHPDDGAKKILMQMQKRAKELENDGVLILQDRPHTDGRLFFQIVLGLGPLMRAAVDIVSLPSSYEPCGLVQGEAHRFGKKALTTDTGGFHDTIITHGPKKNGYLFERHKWKSEEQNEAIRAALRAAIPEAYEMVQALHHGSEEEAALYLEPMRNLMRDAIQSSWTETPDDSTDIPAIFQYDLLFAKAMKERSRRVISAPFHAQLLTRK